MPRGFANASVGLDEAKTSPLWKSEWGKSLGERAHVFETEEPRFEGPRLAPMLQDREYGQFHNRARQRILDEDSRAQASDAFRVASDELRRAPQSTYHHNIREMMDQIVRNPLEYHRNFMRPYDDIIDDMNIEAEKQLAEKYLPRLKGQAIMNGTFRSPQYARSQERFLQDYLAQLNRDKKKLKMDASDRAWRTATDWLGQTHGYLGTAAQMASQDRESHIKQAQALMGLESEKTKQESARSDILRGQGEREQAQRQKEYEEAYLRHQEPIERRKRNLEREAAVFSNMPQTGENIRQYLPQHSTPISPSSVGAASLFTMADLLSPKKHKTGGRALSLIDQKFKKGGSVPRLAEGGNPYHSTDEEIGFDSPELSILKEEAHRKNPKENPMSSYLSTMAGHMWKNLRNPAEGFGEGMLKGTEAYHAADKRNSVNHHRQMAIVKGIQDSRQKQQQLLADYENHKLTREENIRHHGATEKMSGLQLEELKRHHEKQEEYQKIKADAAMTAAQAKSDLKSNKRYLYDDQGEPFAERTKDDSKTIHDLISQAAKESKALDYYEKAADSVINAEGGEWTDRLSNDTSWFNKIIPAGKTVIRGTSKNLPDINAARRDVENFINMDSSNLNIRTNMGLSQKQASKISLSHDPITAAEAFVSDAQKRIEGLEEILAQSVLKGSSPDERQHIKSMIEEKKQKLADFMKKHENLLKTGEKKVESKPSTGPTQDEVNAKISAIIAKLQEK